LIEIRLYGMKGCHKCERVFELLDGQKSVKLMYYKSYFKEGETVDVPQMYLVNYKLWLVGEEEVMKWIEAQKFPKPKKVCNKERLVRTIMDALGKQCVLEILDDRERAQLESDIRKAVWETNCCSKEE